MIQLKDIFNVVSLSCNPAVMKKRYEEYLKEFIGKRSPGKGSYEPIKRSAIQVTEKKMK